jgi:hypothetical protein
MFSAALAAAMLLAPTAALADTLVYNGTPADTWNNYGSGNDYSPANTAVLTTDALDQLYLRSHVTFQTAPASVDEDYNFTTGAGKQISFDWGIDTASWTGVTALITLRKYGGGLFSYDPLANPDNRPALNGSIQNSARLNWFAVPIGFDPNTDSSYNVKLQVFGLADGPKSINIDVNMGAGGAGAIPEPAAWALMIMGFGAAGSMLRRRRVVAA